MNIGHIAIPYNRACLVTRDELQDPNFAISGTLPTDLQTAERCDLSCEDSFEKLIEIGLESIIFHSDIDHGVVARRLVLNLLRPGINHIDITDPPEHELSHITYGCLGHE